ncbi:MAG: cytochrome c biogenesis protein CcdA, partial [Planctomycetota bacterium]|nr:cytochrome c biogenesis protein CcdA [Planctomycetota bacterium]
MRTTTLLLAAILALTSAPALLAAEPGAEPWLRAAAHVDHAALARGAGFHAAVAIDLDAGYHLNANPPSLEFQIPTKVEPAPHPGITWGEVACPEGEALTADWAGDAKVRGYSGRTILLVAGTVADDAPLGPATLRFTLAYQGCDASTCYPPGERTLEVATEIVAADAQPAATNASIFEAVRAGRGPARRSPKGEGGSGRASPSAVARDTAGEGPPVLPHRARSGTEAPAIRFEGESDVAGWLERGLPVYFGLLLLGGLALNLTPCVFPLIPITMNVFAQQGESRPLKVLPLAVTYALGLALTFTVMGVLAALAGRSMGLVLQSPWGVLGVVAVLAAMMASAFGAFEISLPAGAMGKLGARRGFLGAAFMGMVMGAIAAPCVGPFLVALIALVASKQSIAFGAASFFVTGLGLGLPYVFLGTFTSLVNRFPRSGGWMVWVKRLMAMALGGLILYFLRPFIAPAMFRPMVLALVVFAAVYLGLLEGLSRRPFSTAFWIVRIVAAVAILAGGIGFYAAYAPEAPAAAPETEAAPDQGPHVEWTDWHAGALADAKQAGRGVLLYFGAEWCTECRARQA